MIHPWPILFLRNTIPATPIRRGASFPDTSRLHLHLHLHLRSQPLFHPPSLPGAGPETGSQLCIRPSSFPQPGREHTGRLAPQDHQEKSPTDRRHHRRHASRHRPGAATITRPKHHTSLLGDQLTNPDRSEPALRSPPCHPIPDTTRPVFVFCPSAQAKAGAGGLRPHPHSGAGPNCLRRMSRRHGRPCVDSGQQPTIPGKPRANSSIH